MSTDHTAREDTHRGLALLRWLHAQITHDQLAADRQDDEMPGAHQTGPMSNEFSPQRVLAECAFKTGLVHRHAPTVADHGPHEGTLICGGCSQGEDLFTAYRWPCQDIRALAAVYAHRPGYNPGWGPDPAIG